MQSEDTELETTAEDAEEPASDNPSVARSTAVISSLTLVSRITGFIRTWAMAFALGNTLLAAGFSLANNLPNMIYELVAGGVLSAAFLPIYLQQYNKRKQEGANAYANNLLSIVLVLLGVIAILASIFAPQVMVTQSLFSESDEETVRMAVWLFRFLAFEIIFYGMSALFSGLLNAQRRFFWPAISSVFMNVVAIITFFGYPAISSFGEVAGMTWLGVGSALSILVMAAVQIPALVKTGFHFHFTIDLHGEGLRDTVSLALPAIACTAINLVALSFMNSCALHVAANGPASVSYAWMWYQFPYGVLGVALSTALFTEMSDCTARKDWQGFKSYLTSGLSTTWVLIIPMAVAVFVCAGDLIGLYTAGRFTVEDIAPIAALLSTWAVALPFYAGYMYVYRAYSSLKDLKTVAICNLIMTCFQVTMYMLFTGVIDTGGALEMGLQGIAVTDTIFYACMLIILLIILRRRIGAFGIRTLVLNVVKVLVACIITCALMLLWHWFLSGLFATTNILTSFILVCAVGIPTLVIAYGLCALFRVRELNGIAERLLGRFRRSER